MVASSSRQEPSFWEAWHRNRIEHYPGGEGPFPLAREAVAGIMKPGNARVLDLGCGQGSDSRLFAERGMMVTAVDFSLTALTVAVSKPYDFSRRQTFILADISRDLPFMRKSFQLVYSHLSLHYFDDRTTRRLFSEILRVLVPGGLLVANVKSVHDRRYGQGTKLARDTFNYHGHVRHFFSEAYLSQLLEDFQIEDVSEYEDCYDEMVSTFLKFIARRPQQ